MAHLQYSEREKGFFLNTRKDIDLGWTFFDEAGNEVGHAERTDLTNYERILAHQHRLKARREGEPSQ